MTSVRVEPAARVDAAMTVPGDKSISHRALILGALAGGRTYLGNLSPAADVAATVRCLQACGVSVRPFGADRASLDGRRAGASLQSPESRLDCANSGTTMRLLAGALAGNDCEAELDGDGSLRRRPMARVAEPLTAMGAAVTTREGLPPLHVRGSRELQPLHWVMPVASAQVKSAILLAGLSAAGVTRVTEPAPTRDHTERLLRLCSVAVDRDHNTVILDPSPPQPFGLRMPGDMSAAAFFLALAASRAGWRMRCAGVGLNPGRTGILDVLRAMGAGVSVSEGDPAGGVEPQGDVEIKGAALRGVEVAGGLTVRCIDELPVIAVLATQAEGETRIRDAAELRGKESDRIDGIAAGLRAMGAACETAPDGLTISGPARLRAARVDSLGDHRLAMAWAVAAALADPASGATMIDGAGCVAVSYPRFFEDLAAAVSGSR